MNVADHIARAVARYPQAAAAICGDESRTFAELDDRSTRLAQALLKLGLAKGDRVATLLENSIRCVEVDFALAKAGLVRVSINPRSLAKDVAYIAADSDAKVLIYGACYAETIAEASLSLDYLVRVTEGPNEPPRAAGTEDYEALLSATPATALALAIDAEDLYCLFYTSGTTGKPKGVMLSHRAILQTAFNLLLENGPQTSGEKILLLQPLSHGAGFYVLPWIMRGCTCVILRAFDPAEVLRLTAALEIETVKLIPTMLQRILRLDAFPIALPKLRQIIYGASPLAPEVLRDAMAKFGRKFVQIYGQSEAPMAITVLPLEDHDPDTRHPERLASAGRPWLTVDVRVVDATGRDVPAGEPGELVIRAPQMMLGYWKRPDLTAEAMKDGWLHTKDMARLDASGYVYLLGRKDEMIISGGYNIAPREVEDVLYTHPAVQEVAVVGEPDPEWGQAVVAYVAFRDGTSGEELVAFAKPHLGFKRPKRVYRVTELPKNANGKIQKTALNPSLVSPI